MKIAIGLGCAVSLWGNQNTTSMKEFKYFGANNGAFSVLADEKESAAEQAKQIEFAAANGAWPGLQDEKGDYIIPPVRIATVEETTRK